MNKLKSLSLSLAVLALIGCSDSNSTPVQEELEVQEELIQELLNPSTGIFIDSAVAGLSYVCSSGNSGVTNTLGEFTCESGDSVSFSLGSISLGTVSLSDFVAPNYLTPLALFNGNEEAALNFAQLLQTLDSDSDLSNGIDIDEELLATLGTLDFTSPTFDEDVQELLNASEDGIVLVDEVDAQAHMDETFVVLDINNDGTSPRDEEEEEVIVEPVVVTPPTPTPTPTPSQSPVFTSSADVSVVEGEAQGEAAAPARSILREMGICYPVAITLTATDPQSDDINYTISGGDAASFDINTTSGEVKFNTLPDFETKRTYLFTATATDSDSNVVTQDVNISITDKEESHNGTLYGSVVSPYTGILWTDRNLGASQVCTVLDDTACYGDYYQWGRNHDGHQLSTSTSVDINDTAVADVTNVGHGNFLESNSTYDYDWTRGTDAPDGTARVSEWSTAHIDGSGVCPDGFRVPTIAELEAETTTASTPVTDNIDAYANFLKLPSAGDRDDVVGSLHNQGSDGIVWSSSITGSYSHNLYFYSGDAGTNYGSRAIGFSVRCLKD